MYVIGATIDLVNDPNKVNQRILKAAARNKPKRPKLSLVFDVSVVLNMMGAVARNEELKTTVERLIQLCKTLLGWRSADLTGCTVNWGLRTVQNDSASLAP